MWIALYFVCIFHANVMECTRPVAYATHPLTYTSEAECIAAMGPNDPPEYGICAQKVSHR